MNNKTCGLHRKHDKHYNRLDNGASRVFFIVAKNLFGVFR